MLSGQDDTEKKKEYMKDGLWRSTLTGDQGMVFRLDVSPHWDAKLPGRLVAILVLQL